MNFTVGLFPDVWLWLGHGVYWPMLLWAVARAPWSRLRHNESSHVWFGATVGTMLLWTMEAGLADGMSLHLLGTTVLTLLFGWHLAVLSISLVVLGISLNDGVAWVMLPTNALLLGLVPVSVSYGIYRLVDRALPNHFFIYIFLSAFLGGAVAMGAVGLVGAVLLSASGAYSLDYIHYNFLRYLPLIMFPEAFITGMLMTLFVVFYPRWVSTFDDERYLRNR